MTNRATLEALLARVLEGTGPDRELDAEIAWLTHPSDRKRLGPPDLQRECFHLGLPEPQWVSWESVASFHPAYTTSLDAALTLVPEGWRINLLSEWDNETLRAKGAWQAILMPIGKGDSIHAGMRTRCDHAATPARALIAACLKARMEVQPSSST